MRYLSYKTSQPQHNVKNGDCRVCISYPTDKKKQYTVQQQEMAPHTVLKPHYSILEQVLIWKVISELAFYTDASECTIITLILPRWVLV
jgi:hypothetical protein